MPVRRWEGEIVQFQLVSLLSVDLVQHFLENLLVGNKVEDVNQSITKLWWKSDTVRWGKTDRFHFSLVKETSRRTFKKTKIEF